MSQEPVKPHWNQPSHPGLLRIEVSPGSFTSAAYAEQSLPAGALLAKITTATEVPVPAYSSVQTPAGHIELNSDLIYVNHSCSPNLVFDMTKMEVRVGEDRNLEKGDLLTFFYPSSEWDMSQPFDCLCRSENCLGVIDGAKHLDDRGVDLSKYWLNPHVEKLLQEKRNGANGHAVNGAGKSNGYSNGHHEQTSKTNGYTNGHHEQSGKTNGYTNGHEQSDKTKGGAAYEVDGRIGTSSRELAGECGGGTVAANGASE